MNRTLKFERAMIPDPASRHILVATEFSHPERGQVRCSAAPAVAAWLRRRGQPVRLGPAPGSFRPASATWLPEGTVICAATYLSQERAVGLGCAAPANSDLADAAFDAVRTWMSAIRTRRAVLAATNPSCQGELDSLARAQAVLAAAPGKVYIYGQLTRNPHVADDLKRQGAVFAGDLEQIPDGATVVLAAHGVPPRLLATAAARGMRIIDTTCPLVAAVHARARSYAEDGDEIALIGRPGHAAVAGIVGQAPDGVRLVSTVEDAADFEGESSAHLSYLLQTGIPVDEAAPVTAMLRSRFPAMRGPLLDRFCYAASDRLGAIRRLAEVSDVLIVAGAADSADARWVVQAATSHGTRAHLAVTASDLQPEWLGPAATVGLTAGIAARLDTTDEVLAILSGLGPLSVTRLNVRTDVLG